jgi:1,2-diacylglycerol 3-beta-galactosyltransferase
VVVVTDLATTHAWWYYRDADMYLYGFVHEMPDFMQAADILVTKAGPSTVSEAFIVGLPIVLFDYIPGQEDGNVQYVIRHGAGAWAPHPDQVVAVLKGWLSDPERRRRAAEASKRLAGPEAARQIADLLAAHLRVELPL